MVDIYDLLYCISNSLSFVDPRHQPDLERYISHLLGGAASSSKVSEFYTKSGRSFIYTALLKDQLLGPTGLIDMEKLDKFVFPDGLYAAYQAIFRAIKSSPDFSEHTARLIHVLCCMQEPLLLSDAWKLLGLSADDNASESLVKQLAAVFPVRGVDVHILPQVSAGLSS